MLLLIVQDIIEVAIAVVIQTLVVANYIFIKKMEGYTMNNRLIFLSLVFASLASLTTGLDAYWVDRDGNEHYGVVGGSAHVAGDAVEDTGYVLGGLFGAHHHYYDEPNDHHCRHHPYDPVC